MFKVFNDGFGMDLDNGYTISVQFSPFHMCSNRMFEKEYKEQLLNKRLGDFTECRNAEIAVKDTITGKFLPIQIGGERCINGTPYKFPYIHENGDDVQGYQTVNDLIALINEVKDYPNTDSKMFEVRERAMSNA